MASEQPATTLLDVAKQVDDTYGTFSSIPIIDLQNARSPEALLRRQVAEEIRKACLTSGFFYIKNHGVPEELATSVVERTKSFWDWPEERKMEYDLRKTANFMGYGARLTMNINPENHGDFHEAFHFSVHELEGHPSTPNVDGAMARHTFWPPELPEMRSAASEYYSAVTGVGKTLFSLFALALDLPESFFDDKTTTSAPNMGILHYPPQTGEIDDRVIGIGAHTDFDCFTILWQDEHKALQVLNKEGKWIDAIPIPGTFVVNLADQLARWTNDIFRSTMHRAVNRTGVRRYSIPVFFGTSDDVLVEALPSCVSPDRPAKYEPIFTGDYLKSRLANSYGHSAPKKD